MNKIQPTSRGEWPLLPDGHHWIDLGTTAERVLEITIVRELPLGPIILAILGRGCYRFSKPVSVHIVAEELKVSSQTARNIADLVAWQFPQMMNHDWTCLGEYHQKLPGSASYFWNITKPRLLTRAMWNEMIGSGRTLVYQQATPAYSASVWQIKGGCCGFVAQLMATGEATRDDGGEDWPFAFEQGDVKDAIALADQWVNQIQPDEARAMLAKDREEEQAKRPQPILQKPMDSENF